MGVAALAAGSVYAFAGKGDLNGDGNTDYADVELLEKHLIDLEPLTVNRKDAADLNSDGTLTVTDLSLLIRKIEKTVDYEVALSSAMEQFHYEKREKVELKFLADVSYDARIEKVTVNGKEYEAEKEEGSSLYTVRTEAGETAGVKEFYITEVLLEGGQRIKTNHTEKIDVLKTMPEVEGFLAEELTNTAQMKVTVFLKDEDSAVVSAGMEVVKAGGGSTAVSEELKAGENEFVLDLDEGTAYAVNMTVSYDRASGELPSGDSYGGSFAVIKEIEMDQDYRFSFHSLRAFKGDGTETERFSRNEPVILAFESTNTTGFAPERAVVNGQTAAVVRTEQGFTVTLDGFDTVGMAAARVEQVILENGKAFELSENNEITLHILKEMPQAEELKAVEDAETGQFKVSFRLTDADGALSGHKVLIRKADGTIAGEQAFGENDVKDGLFEAAVPLADVGLTTGYTVQVTADCDLSEDGTELAKGKIFAETSVKAETRLLITGSRAGAAYVEKGGITELFYELDHNG